LQFYIYQAVLHDIICLQVFMCILLSFLPFYVFVSLPSVSPLFHVLKVKILEVHVPESPTARPSGGCDQCCGARSQISGSGSGYRYL